MFCDYDHSGSADNVIPDTAYVGGTIRTFVPEVQDLIHRRIREITAGQAASYNVDAKVEIEVGYPATVNNAEKVDFAAEVAREVSGEAAVDPNTGMEMGAEDFSYMLNARPGAYFFLGQGEGAGLHNPNYDFNDEVAPVGASFFARLVEKSQPLT